MEDRTNRAIIGIQKTHQDYNTHFYIVDYTGSVSMVTVPVVSEITMIMRAVQENGRYSVQYVYVYTIHVYYNNV